MNHILCIYTSVRSAHCSVTSEVCRLVSRSDSGQCRLIQCPRSPCTTACRAGRPAGAARPAAARPHIHCPLSPPPPRGGTPSVHTPLVLLHIRISASKSHHASGSCSLLAHASTNQVKQESCTPARQLAGYIYLSSTGQPLSSASLPTERSLLRSSTRTWARDSLRRRRRRGSGGRRGRVRRGGRARRPRGGPRPLARIGSRRRCPRRL